MKVSSFSEIEEEFWERVSGSVYCNMATVDLHNRPRSRIVHPVWHELTGWVISWMESPKAKHLPLNPHVSLAYFCHDKNKPVYIECTAEWLTEKAEQQQVWELYKTIPPPIGFDPTPHYGSIDHPYFGLLKLTPWRIELYTLGGETIIWRKA